MKELPQWAEGNGESQRNNALDIKLFYCFKVQTEMIVKHRPSCCLLLQLLLIRCSSVFCFWFIQLHIWVKILANHIFHVWGVFLSALNTNLNSCCFSLFLLQFHSEMLWYTVNLVFAGWLCVEIVYVGEGTVLRLLLQLHFSEILLWAWTQCSPSSQRDSWSDLSRISSSRKAGVYQSTQELKCICN